MLRAALWITFILIQIGFIAGGLAIIFWTLNTWDADRKLDAIFGAGLGAYAFLFAWRVVRGWAVHNVGLWNPGGKRGESGGQR